MTTSGTKRLLVLGLLAAVPSAAGALELIGRLGFSYGQSDSWPVAGPKSTAPHLDLDLGLDARGVVVRRDVVDWSARAAYRRLYNEADGVRTQDDRALLYNANATAFGGPSSRLTLRLNASRAEHDFATERTPGTFGQSLVQTIGADASLRAPNRPQLDAGYQRITIEDSYPGTPLHTQSADVITSGFSHGTSAFGFSGRYSADLRDGDRVTDRFERHTATLSGRVPLPNRTEFGVEEQLYVVKPDEIALGTFDQETSALRAFFTNSGTPGRRHIVSYLYARSLNEALARPPEEIRRQSARYEGDLQLTGPELFTRWLVDASLAESRAGTAEERTTGETLGAQLWWRRGTPGSSLDVHAGPTVGLLQSDADGNLVGYGASGGLRLSRPWAARAVQLEYQADYFDDAFATAGWRFTHSFSSSVSGAIGAGRYNAMFRGNSFRSSSPLFGATAGRSLEAWATALFTRHELEARATLQNGMAGATPGEFVGDGLLLPAPFDSSTRDISFRASTRLTSALGASAAVRFASSDLPGTPSAEQADLVGSVHYAYGAFRISFEDRFTTFEQPGGWGKANFFIVRVSRTLVWR